MIGQGPGSPSPRGVLVDFGGVLTNPLTPLMSAFCRAKGLPEDAIDVAMGSESPLKADIDAHERGELAEEEFLARFAAQLGLAPGAMDNLWADLQLDELMFEVIGDVRRRGVRTCLLSNSWGLTVYPRPLLATVFDGIVISGEVGMRKPDVEIFLHAAAVIGVEPARCLVVDDSPSNFPGAHAAGMAVIYHHDAATTARALRRRLDRRPRRP